MNTVPALRLQSIAVENFKSLQKSGAIRLKPLTAIIGSNGSGKSSLLEAVETYRKIVLGGLDAALEDWSGFEHIRHKSVQHAMTGAAAADPSRQYNPMRFTLAFKREKLPLRLEMAVNSRDQGNIVYIQNERITLGKDVLNRQPAFPEGRSMLALDQSIAHVSEALRGIAFLRLNPVQIGALQPTRRSGGRMRLAADGANVAEYLIDLRKRSASAYEEITLAMRYVLPYASEVQPKMLDTGVIQRGYLQLLEKHYEIPGWLMSTGSLRALPLIAILLDPDPPPVIFIEEIENGLDPRTIGLVVDLLKAATSSGRTQIVTTTHSPYLLDQLDLDDVLLCERKDKGPAFSWPADREELGNWRQRFMPGRLYTMNVLQSPPPAATTTEAREGEAPEGGWGKAE
ncbi:chromosome segregation protein SMC [Betaproteobacteria bacterium]|nr:chromosome segregation protein SMC [Betaproteobacteria bacterium]GHU17791.1 chromosome segregation protein SMC [Betaproteobacteria bacterium]